MSTTFRDRALAVIAVAFGGEHHVFSLKWNKDQFGLTPGKWPSCSFLVNTGIGTYDFADLTKLVVACHDECVRAQVDNGGPGRLKITLSHRERQHVHPDACAHPTLDQHVEQIRRGGSYQPLFNLLRADKDAAQ
jgi:hypothetical protein